MNDGGNIFMKITSNLLSVEKIAESYHITYKNTKWHTLNQGPTIIHNDNKKEICSCLKEEYYHTGCSKGILSYYPSFITYVYIEEAMQELHFQLIPINDISFKEILWPSPIEFTHPNGYSAIPYMQGILIPNNYEYDYRNLSFDGQFASNNAYMPFWSQYIESGYVLINETYWDCKYGIEQDHKHNNPNL